MRLLGVIINLLCFMMLHANPVWETRHYCYDPPQLNCAEEHILDCGEEQVINTETAGFSVSFLKNRNYSECQTGEDECRNKATCCRFINSNISVLEKHLVAADNTPLINFIKTECSMKSSCIVSLYYSPIDSSDLYDYVTYNYSCILAVKDEITVNFLANESTKFTGNKFPTLYYVEYTGNETKDDNVILNRECIVTTTEKDITLTITELNLQADDCCRFHITGYNVLEYCSQSGSSSSIKGKYIGNNTATIRLEDIVNKDGDSFLILVEAAGDVTIECRDTTNVDKPEPSICQYPTPESSTINSNSMSTTNSLGTILPEEETNLPGIIGGTIGGLVVLVVIIIVVVVIIRKKCRVKVGAIIPSSDHDNREDNRKDHSKDNPGINS